MSNQLPGFQEGRVTGHSRHAGRVFDADVSFGDEVKVLSKVRLHAESSRHFDEPDYSGDTYFIAGGWGTGLDHLHDPMCTVAGESSRAVGIQHGSKRHGHAIARNVFEVEQVVEEIAPKADGNVHYVGLSMDGAVAIRALRRIGKHVKSVTAVAPAEHIDMGPEDILGFGQNEMGHMSRHPIEMIKFGIGAAKSVRHRVRGFLGEGRDMTTEHIDEVLNAAMREPHPHTRLVICTEDTMVNGKKLREAARRLPYDEVVEWRGNHFDLLGNRRLMRRIIDMDDELSA